MVSSIEVIAINGAIISPVTTLTAENLQTRTKVAAGLYLYVVAISLVSTNFFFLSIHSWLY